MEHIFRHELIHYRRRVLWMNIIVLLVSSMHWFNPFVYLMAEMVRSDCEVACDEAAVAEKDIDDCIHYGETIIGFIDTKSTMTPVLSTYFYGGKNNMKKDYFQLWIQAEEEKGWR